MRSLKTLIVFAAFFVISQAALAQSDTAEIRAIWNQEVFVLINTSSKDVNVSTLSFSSANGEILPENWVMDTYGDNNLPYSLAEFTPGSCLLAYLSGTSPDLPENVECSRVAGEFTLTNAGDIVWDVTRAASALMWPVNPSPSATSTTPVAMSPSAPRWPTRWMPP